MGSKHDVLVYRRFVRAVGRVPVGPVRRKILSNAKLVIRSHASRGASDDEVKVFREGCMAAIELMESLPEEQLETVFCNPRWKT
jgi:hypothetical protein